MNLTFQQGTKLILTDGTNRYELLVGSANASQTYIEGSQSVKTLHSPYLVDRTFVNSKGAVNLTFTCHLTTTGISDGIILEWFGFGKVSDRYLVKPLFDAAPLSGSKEILDVYIVANGTIYKIEQCIGQNLSFKLNRTEILTVEVSAVAKDLTTVSSVPVVGSLLSQSSSMFHNGTSILAGYPNTAGYTCEITRNIMWAGKKGVHDIGSLYTVKNPILQSFSVSGSITQNKIDNTITTLPNTTINFKYGPTFEINLDACNTTDRWTMESVHKRITDYKLLPIASNSYIKF